MYRDKRSKWFGENYPQSAEGSGDTRTVKTMRWKYDNGVMVWKTPLCTYKVFPLDLNERIIYVLEYSDNGRYLFDNRKDAKNYAKLDYENRISKIEEML